MRQNHHIAMRHDNQLIVLMHLSQLVTLLIGFGSLIVPLIIWSVNRERVFELNEHGKNILNFQISILIYSIICIPLILFLGLGLVGLIVLCFISIIFPIINALKANNGEIPKYPLSLSFIS